MLTKNLLNCGGITSRFTLKRAEMQMSTPDPTVTTRQYCASGRERDSGRLYESGYKKKNEKNGT